MWFNIIATYSRRVNPTHSYLSLNDNYLVDHGILPHWNQVHNIEMNGIILKFLPLWSLQNGGRYLGLLSILFIEWLIWRFKFKTMLCKHSHIIIWYYLRMNYNMLNYIVLQFYLTCIGKHYEWNFLIQFCKLPPLELKLCHLEKEKTTSLSYNLYVGSLWS